MLGSPLLLTSSGSGMSTLLENVGTFVTDSVGWIGSFAGAITSNDILCLGVVIVPLAGFGIGCIKRLLSQRV